MEKRQKVLVAMSGGVDSSVAAALLKKQGYQVAGVFMHFWAEKGGGTKENLCCSAGAREAAKAVAKKLGIPFYEWHFEKEFKSAVVDYFLAEERRGRTPNPCVVCNKKIKFGLMFKKAMEMEAEYVATGHYARIHSRKLKVKNEKLKITNKNLKLNYKLLRGKDKEKDQSYFLYNLTQKQLSRILFPLGEYTKEEVYSLAKKWKLPYRQEESFDLCFVGRDTDSFLKKHLNLKAGKIMNLSGQVLGEHQGLAYYTIGQRKNIPLAGLPGPWRGPWWVVKKDQARNILYVSNQEKDLYSNKLAANKINWLSGRPPKLPMKVWAKIRYKSEATEATIGQAQGKTLRFGSERNLAVTFKKSQRAITPGQSVVFYGKDGEVLGGGVIN